MNIGRIYYPVTGLGPGRRVGIWTRGCPRRCEGCISPEFWATDPAAEFSPGEIMEMIGRIEGPIEGFTVSGGEPFYRPRELRELLERLSDICDDILIYTGFTLEELRAGDRDTRRALELAAAVIDGEYVPALNDGRGIRGSSNQRIHVFRHRDRYRGAESWPRSLQTVRRGEGVVLIGIPPLLGGGE